MKPRPLTLLCAAAAILCTASSAPAADPNAPATRVAPVTDTIHGFPVTDNFRWLEDGNSPEVKAWTDAQMAYFKAYVDTFSGRPTLTSELTSMLSAGGIGEVFSRGNLYFSIKRHAGQNQPVMYLQLGLNGKPEVLIDPNRFSSDGTRAMDWYYPSDDGSLMAYGVSSSGTEQATLYVMKNSDRTLLSDTIPGARSASVAWLPDNSGFYYTRNPLAGTVPAGDEAYYRRIYFHRLGSAWQDDPLFWEDAKDKTAWPGAELSPDGRWLFISNYKGWSKNELYIKDLTRPTDQPRSLVGDSNYTYRVIPLKDRFFILTNNGGSTRQIMVGKYGRPLERDWRKVIPERAGTSIVSFKVIGHRIAVEASDSSGSHICLYTFSGRLLSRVHLQPHVTIESLSGEPGGHDLFFRYSSYAIPPTVMRYDMAKDTFFEFDRMQLDVDFSDFQTTLEWYTSKDGTKIPMYVVARKGIQLDGTNPVLLTGYGGFGRIEGPLFSRKTALWLMHGGVYVDAVLRGGGEYGESWRRAGMLDKKQNVFDDFIAAAQYLINENYTNPDRLVIYGGSNGGLLIGAVVTQRPDLFKAAVCDVPLLDMIRYDKFQIGKLWVPEFGTSDDSTQFTYLLRYSPYQNVHTGVKYPAILFKAGESDYRVDPLHARKMAALMQASTGSSNPIYLRVDSKSGHGEGKPTDKVAEEIVDEYCFIFLALGPKI